MEKNNSLTGHEEVLLAAYSLSKDGKKEFSEWELTVETWKLNKERWGLKGFENKYPNHKRVMVVLMTRGPQNILDLGWVKRTRPNHYRITDLGISRCPSLQGLDKKKIKKGYQEYIGIIPYIGDKNFQDYLSTGKGPKIWTNVASFLNLSELSNRELKVSLSKIQKAIKETLRWMKDEKREILYRDDSLGKPVTKEQVMKLDEFLKVIERDFKKELDAIRNKN